MARRRKGLAAGSSYPLLVRLGGEGGGPWSHGNWNTAGLYNRSDAVGRGYRGDVATAQDTMRHGEGGEIPQFTSFSCPSILGHCLPVGYLYPEAWGQKSLGNISHGTKQSQGRGEGIR